MIDFKKLSDPTYMAESKARRDAEDAALEEESKRIKAALSLFAGERFDALKKNEQELVDSCAKATRRMFPLSAKQKQWLFDIAARFAPPAAAPITRDDYEP